MLPDIKFIVIYAAFAVLRWLMFVLLSTVESDSASLDNKTLSRSSSITSRSSCLPTPLLNTPNPQMQSQVMVVLLH